MKNPKGIISVSLAMTLLIIAIIAAGATYFFTRTDTSVQNTTNTAAVLNTNTTDTNANVAAQLDVNTTINTNSVVNTNAATTSTTDDGTHSITAKKNAKDATTTDVYVHNDVSGVEQLFGTYANVDAERAVVGQYRNGNVYIVKTFLGEADSSGNYPNFRSELWRYTSSTVGTKLLDNVSEFLVSLDEQYIAYLENRLGDSTEVFVLVSREGIVLKKLKHSEFAFPTEGSSLAISQWNGHDIWIENIAGSLNTAFAQVNAETLQKKVYALPDPVDTEYELQSKTLLYAYSNYPSFLSEKSTSGKMTLYVYSLESRKTTIIATNIGKPFNIKWVKDRVLEYDNPEGSGRVQKIIP